MSRVREQHLSSSLDKARAERLVPLRPEVAFYERLTALCS
jgi:hypothetical protein